jgi:hypothetical protein
MSSIKRLNSKSKYIKETQSFMNFSYYFDFINLQEYIFKNLRLFYPLKKLYFTSHHSTARNFKLTHFFKIYFPSLCSIS